MAKKQNKGLGDTIESVLEPLGIKKVFDVLGIDCNCDKRRDELNTVFPSFKNINCLNENDYNYLKDYFQLKNYQHPFPNEKEVLNGIYQRVFDMNLELEGCPSCWRDYIANLKQVYDKTI